MTIKLLAKNLSAQINLRKVINCINYEVFFADNYIKGTPSNKIIIFLLRVILPIYHNNNLIDYQIEWRKRSFSSSFLRFNLKLMFYIMVRYFGRFYILEFLVYYLLDRISLKDLDYKYLLTTTETKTISEIIMIYRSPNVKMISASWDHPIKLPFLPKGVELIVDNEELMDDYRQAFGEDIHIHLLSGSILFSKNELQKIKASKNASYQFYYFIQTYPRREFFEQEISLAVLLQHIVGCPVVFRLYPGLSLQKRFRDMYPNIQFEDADYSIASKEKMYSNALQAIEVVHVGTTAGFEAELIGAKVRYMDLSVFQDVCQQGAIKYWRPSAFDLKNTQLQYHHVKYFQTDCRPFNESGTPLTRLADELLDIIMYRPKNAKLSK